MEHKNSDRLREWLTKAGLPDLAKKDTFTFTDSAHEAAKAALHRRIPDDHLDDRAAFRLLTRDIPKTTAAQIAMAAPAASDVWERIATDVAATRVTVTAFTEKEERRHRRTSMAFWLAFGMVVAFLLFFAITGHAQTTRATPAVTVTSCGTDPGVAVAGNWSYLTRDLNGNVCAGVSVSATIATTGLAISVNAGSSSAVGTPVYGEYTASAPSYTISTGQYPLSLDGNGNLRVAGSFTAPALQNVNLTQVDGAAVPQAGSGLVAVSGAVSSGTAILGGPVIVGGTSGGTAEAIKVEGDGTVVVDGSGHTQPVSGTVTANAGTGTFTISGTVTVGNTVNVNFLTSSIGVTVNNASIPVTESGTWTVQPGNTPNTTPWLATINQGGNSATVSAAGALKVDASGATVNVNFLTATLAENITQFGGNNVNTGVGGSGTGTPRFTIADDSFPVGTPIFSAVCSSSICAGLGAQVASNSLGMVVNYQTTTSGGITVAMTATTSTLVVGSGVGQYIYLTSCTASNASTTVSTDIIVQDGSGGTTKLTIPAPAAAVATTGGGGAVWTSGPYPLRVTDTAGDAVYAANVTTGSSTKISCNGFASTVKY